MTSHPAEAGSAKSKTIRTPAVFDVQTRKRTRAEWASFLNGASYASLKLTQHTDRRRDDDTRDKTQRAQAYLGFAARADLGYGVIGFGHAELTQTQAKSSSPVTDLKVKELLLSAPLAGGLTLSAGRMRFRDRDRWVADSAVDGLHLGWRWSSGAALQGLDLAALRGTHKSPSNYAMTHLWQMAPGVVQGVFALAEDTAGGALFHLSAYHQRDVTARLSWHINAATRVGDTDTGRSSGAGFDARTTYKLSSALNPQITLGLAAGTSGFQQSGLHSNKTYDGAQTQVHRYGEVLRPELTNLAVASASYGLRPSRSFSASLTALAYTQVTSSGPAPVTKLGGDLTAGETTGGARLIGHEINLSGAWRPTKTSKFEIGLGRFMPSRAYADTSPSTRMFARYTVNF